MTLYIIVRMFSIREPTTNPRHGAQYLKCSFLAGALGQFILIGYDGTARGAPAQHIEMHFGPKRCDLRSIELVDNLLVSQYHQEDTARFY
jgi:hypothetical protein